MEKKVILAIADGVGDRPNEILNGMTPLEYANTPNLDKLAKTGTTGIMDVLAAGIPIGTDLGHMILFGYGIDDYPGRGPIEASGRGLDLLEGDVAFRSNFATVDEDFNVVDRRAQRIRENTNQLAEALNGLTIDGVQVLFKEATEHRAVLILRGKGLSANISDTDPKLEGVSYKKCVATEDSQEAEFTANVLNKFLLKANEILKEHNVNKSRIENNQLPANFILTRGAGIMPNIIKTTEKYNFKGSCIAAEGTVLGVAKIAGLNPVSDKKMTGNLDTDISIKAEKVLKELETSRFVAVNMKATDLMGHDNKPLEKVKAVELFDELIGKLMAANLKDTIIAIAADHSTPCERKEHSGDPVPILINGPGVRRDRNTAFNEIDCSYGGLGRIKGYEFINTLFDYLELTKKQGN